MTDILVFEDSLARNAAALAERDVRVVCWHHDGRFSVNGATVPATDIAPEVGWISFDVLVNRKLPDYVDALAGFDSVRWVQSANAGLDHPAYVSLARNGVRLSKSWAQSIPIAEYTIAHALDHLQGLDGRRQAQRENVWRNLPFKEIYGSRWLIVGFGHIGRRIAERIRPFECHVTTLRESRKLDNAANAVIGNDELMSTLGNIDIVVLACPETDKTRGMVDAAFIGAMKPGSLLVNIARGGLIDDEALLAGLDAGRPGAAVLDVFNVEPLPSDHAYWNHPRVTVTAHMSNAGAGTVTRGDEQFLGNLDAYLAGETPTDEVDTASLLPGS